MSKIIDVSFYNGIIDFKKVKADDVTDVIIRANLGVGTIDHRLAINANAAHAAGLNVGYYHVSYADMKNGGSIELDAIAEADDFLKNIELLPVPQYLVLDAETETKLTDAQFEVWVQTFLNRVQDRSGITPIIYTNGPYMDAHLAKDHKLGNYPLWIANYNDVESPKLPNGWSKYMMWQYTEKGKVNGVIGYVDMSKMQD